MRPAISNIETWGLPKIFSSLASALMLRLLAGSCRLLALMYTQSLLMISVRGKGSFPTTAAKAALGVKGFMKAGLGARFFSGAAAAAAVVAFFAVAMCISLWVLGCRGQPSGLPRVVLMLMRKKPFTSLHRGFLSGTVPCSQIATVLLVRGLAGWLGAVSNRGLFLMQKE